MSDSEAGADVERSDEADADQGDGTGGGSALNVGVLGWMVVIAGGFFGMLSGPAAGSAELAGQFVGASLFTLVLVVLYNDYAS